MKKIVKNINLIMCLLACLFVVSACTDDNELGKNNQSFGYFQLKIRKAQSKGITAGSELENLKDAKKVQVDLLIDNRQITQTLNLLSVSDEAAEFGLTSESMQLLTGKYTLTAYRIFGEYIEGSTEGDKAPVLQEGEPDDLTYFEVAEQQMTTVTLDVVAQLRGKLSLIIGKDFSNIQPARAGGYNPDDFNYNNIASIQVDMKAGLSGPTREYVFKTWRARNDYFFHTDTISLRENNYTVNQVRLLDKNQKLIMVIDQPSAIKIQNQVHEIDTVSIDMPLTPAFKDYIALYNIWKKMDGENWYWNGMGNKEGANWMFKYSDGTPRPMDLWGSQPGISVNPNGRVTSINLGAFNPKGMVPDEIGQLTELQSLYLGNHSDAAQIDPSQGTIVLDKFTLEQQGVDIFANRMDIAKERTRLKYRTKASSLDFKSSSETSFKYAKPYYEHDHTGYSSRITGISPEIAKCKQLSMLSIANNLVKDLPETMDQLENLTDLELYNLEMKEIPAVVTRLKGLIAFNFSKIKGLDKAKFMSSMEKFCDSPSKNTLQLIYLNENLLTELPSNIGNLVNLGLFDVSSNRISTLPMFGKEVSLVQCLLNDNLITSIPDNWFVTDDLEKLLADNNKITSFPNLFSAKSRFQVEEVSLEGNLISKFADTFKGVNIETLNLNSNKLTQLPVEFSKTESTVNFLRVSNNEIDSIPPASIEKFRSLSALEIMGNHLKYVPSNFNVESMPYLDGLDLSYNHFERFPYDVLYCPLAQLRISNQFDRQTGKKTLKEWPANIDKQPTLRVLDVHGNDIRNVLNFPVMLNYLDIHGNPNISITVPYDIFREMLEGTFKLLFDEDQDVKFQN